MELVGVPRELHRFPARFGPRPRASEALPFRPLDQFPPVELVHRLSTMCLDLPGVRSRQSSVASPQSRALCVVDLGPCGPRDAFIDDREFCHLHAPPEGSIHLTLPPEVIEAVVALGWAARHPIQHLGLYQTLVMVYGPRDAAELAIVFRLVEHSLQYARGARRDAISDATTPVLV